MVRSPVTASLRQGRLPKSCYGYFLFTIAMKPDWVSQSCRTGRSGLLLCRVYTGCGVLCPVELNNLGHKAYRTSLDRLFHNLMDLTFKKHVLIFRLNCYSHFPPLYIMRVPQAILNYLYSSLLFPPVKYIKNLHSSST